MSSSKYHYSSMKTFCSYYNENKCKSCDLIESSYSEQITLKQDVLSRSLQGLKVPEFLTPVTSGQTHFRNKAKLVVSGTLEDPVIGILGSELLDCPLHLQKINELLPALKAFISTAKLVPYDISQRTGELKGLILFHGEATNETYLRFVLRSKEAIDRIKKHLPSFQSAFPHLKCISINIQPIPQAILEGEEEIFLTERTSILHRLGDITFRLGPRAFVQTNQVVASTLYRTAANWIEEANLKKFVELYCGQGAFSFFAAPYVESGLGIEINEDAINVANETAKEFKLTQLNFKSADAASVGELVKQFSPEVILVNPPRRGLDKAINVLLDNKPEVIIYSSCSHETLARDLKELKNNYCISKIQIFDMFPNSSHFETLVELKRL